MFSCNKNTLSAFICGFFAFFSVSSAQQIGGAPSIYFNLLPFHAGTEQDLYVGAKDPDGAISEILIRLSEKADGTSTYSEVWQHTSSGDQLTVSNAPLSGVTAAGDFAIWIQVKDNEGNKTTFWQALEVVPADRPVIRTDLSIFSAPISEGDMRPVSFTHEDLDQDPDYTVVRINGLEVLSEYQDSEAGSVTVENIFKGLQPGRHVLGLVYTDLANSRQFAEIRFEIIEDPAVNGTAFPLTAKSETVHLEGVFDWDRMHEEAFILASDTVPESGKWPLVIVLHGGGIFDHGIANIKLDNDQVRTHNEQGQAVMRVHPASSGTWQVDELNAFLDHLIATYPIDTEQIHLMGHSMGAHGAIDWCAQSAERFATMASHSPYYLTTEKVNTGGVLTPEYLAAAQNEAFYSLPYRAYHAENDSWRAGSQLLVAELNQNGPELAEFLLVEGKSHAGGMNWFMASAEVTNFQLSYSALGKIPQLIHNLPAEVPHGSAEALEVAIDAEGQVIVSHAIYLNDVLQYSGNDAVVALNDLYTNLAAETRHTVRVEVEFASGAQLSKAQSFLVGREFTLIEQWLFSGSTPQTGTNGLTVNCWTAVAPNSVVRDGVLHYQTYADSNTVTFPTPIDTTAIDLLKLTVAVEDLQFNVGELVRFIFVASGESPEIEFTAWNSTTHTFAPDIEYAGSNDDLDVTVTALNGSSLGAPLVMTVIWDFEQNLMSFETSGAVQTYGEVTATANMADVVGTLNGFRLDATHSSNAVAFMDLSSVTIETGGYGPSETYAQWKAKYEWSSLPDQEAEADPDGNGLSNLLEYAMGLDPMTRGDLNERPRLYFEESQNEDQVVFAYRRNKHAGEVDLIAKVSGDLIHWDVPSLSWQMSTEDSDGGNVELITFRQARNPSVNKTFMKLELTAAP